MLHSKALSICGPSARRTSCCPHLTAGVEPRASRVCWDPLPGDTASCIHGHTGWQGEHVQDCAATRIQVTCDALCSCGRSSGASSRN